MQAHPGHIHTLIILAQALAKSKAALGLSTFPAISTIFGNSFFTSFNICKKLFLHACAVSNTITSAPASISFLALSNGFLFCHIAAHTTNLLFLSLAAFVNA